jgi:hypothetical protein
MKKKTKKKDSRNLIDYINMYAPVIDSILLLIIGIELIFFSLIKNNLFSWDLIGGIFSILISYIVYKYKIALV